MENLKSFDEFLERRFPDSRRTAYYLMSIHEHLPPQIRRELKQVGWTKAAELTKVVRADGKDFDCAAWVHKARSLPRDQFKREVDQHLTGKDSEPTEIVYFKFYRSQIPAIETAARMLGSDKSRGYCLEMICADFLAGAHLDNGNPQILLHSISCYYKFLPGDSGRLSLKTCGRRHHEQDRSKRHSASWTPRHTKQRLRQQVLRRDGWKCQSCGTMSNLEVHHNKFRSHSGDDSEENLITLCTTCHARVHRR